MRVLITGGAGFVGSHLCDRFLAEGHRVVAMDNLITGNINNIAHHAGDTQFEFIHHDVSNFIYVPGPVDVVLHFASPASPIDYLKYPIQTLKVGALGTHNALGLARAKGAKFMLASTSEIYGDPLVHPQVETYAGNVDTIGPRGVYDEAKRYAESLVMAYNRTHHMDTRIVRIFNTYGPRMRLDDGRVVPNFIGQALRGEALTVYGNGQQTRCFQYVDDLVEGIYRLLNSNFMEPVNIGTTAEMTIMEFAQAVNEVSGNPAGIVIKEDLRIKGDPQTRRPDTTRAKTILGWEPKVSLPDGLKRTIEYFRKVPVTPRLARDFLPVGSHPVNFFWFILAVAAGILVAVAPDYAPAILVAVTLALLATMTPLAALAIVLVLAPMRTLIATEAKLQLPLDIGQITFLLLLVVWGMYRIARHQPLLRFRWSPIYMPVLIFTIAGGLTVFSAVSVTAWLTEWLKWFVILVMITLVLNIGQGRRWEWIVFGLVASGVANAIVGIYIYFGGSGADHLLINGHFFRAFGTFGQPNPFGGFLGLLTPIALTLTYGYLRRAVRQRQSDGMFRIASLLPVVFYAISALVLITGILMSWSRGAWLALVVSLAMVAFALPRRAVQSIIFVGTVAALVLVMWFSGLLPQSIVARVSSSTEEFFSFDDVRGVDITSENYAVVERLAHWQAALNMARANPWLGVGLGNYEIVYDRYRLINWQFSLGHAHNYYLNILAEGGMIGVLGYGLLWIGVLWLTWRARQHPEPLSHAVAAGLMGTWIYLLFHSLLDNLYVNNIFFHLGVLLGIHAILYYQSRSALIWESK